MSIDDYRELVPRDPRMHTEAACADVGPDLFFGGRPWHIKAAKAICAVCPVTAECLEYALANNEHSGIWGGTSGKERRAMKRGAAA